MKKQITFAIAAMLMLASCSEKQVNDPIDPTVAGDKAVDFSTAIVDLKGTPVEGTDMKLDFGAYAYSEKRKGEDQNNLIPDLMFNRHIRYNASGKCHEYSPIMYWPRDGYVNFFAYAPYKSTNRFEKPSNDKDKGWPSIKYVVSHTNIADQEDLMFAEALDMDKDCEKVNLHFRHALTKVGVYGYMGDECGDDYKIVVTKAELKDIKTTGTFNYERYEGQYKNWWNTHNSPVATYVFGLKDHNGVEVKYSNHDNVKYHTQINANNQFLLAMPQEIEDCAKLIVEYKIVKKGKERDSYGVESYSGKDTEEKYTVEFDIRKYVECWVPCEFVAFDIKFCLTECEIKATLCDWELHEVNLDICE